MDPPSIHSISASQGRDGVCVCVISAFSFRVFAPFIGHIRRVGCGQVARAAVCENMSSSNTRDRSRTPRRHVPAETVSLDSFLEHMHYVGCPTVLIKLVYFVMVAYPITCEDLVDSVEVFAGCKSYSQVNRDMVLCMHARMHCQCTPTV
jgi:hypothetical protein